MSDSASAAPAAASRNRPAAAPKAARREKAAREIRLLSGGLPIAQIGPREGERMRAVLEESVARPLPEPPAKILALEAGRLNEALVSLGAMTRANFRAVDRVARIGGEIDRSHGFAAAGRSHSAGTLRLGAPAKNLLALPAAFVRPQMAPQAIEKPRFTPGNGAPSLLPLAGEGGAKRRMRANASSPPPTSSLRMAPQALEKRSKRARKWRPLSPPFSRLREKVARSAG